MKITAQMIHEAYTLAAGSGLRWEQLTQESKQKYAEMASTLNKTLTARPTIVVLCGSTRFSKAFHRANLEETLLGKMVFSIGCDFESDRDLQIAGELTLADKERLDQLHLRKIDQADEILVLNVGGYVGESTAREILYAERHGKKIRWLEPEKIDASFRRNAI